MLTQGQYITGFNGNYRIEQFLGRRANGTVMRCIEFNTQNTYAIKKVPMTCQSEGVLVQNLLKVPFENVVQFYEVFQLKEDQSSFYIVMEYCNNYSLLEQIYTQKIKFSEIQATKILLQVAKGILELNEKQVIHRDIKPENIVSIKSGTSTTELKYKICDLGTSKQAFETNTLGIGTVYYLAPEMISDKPLEYGPKVDVWSLGLVFYEMMIGQSYFQGSGMYSITEKISNFINLSDDQISSFSPATKDLLRGMICKDPSNRFSIQQVIKRLESLIQEEHIQQKELQQQGKKKITILNQNPNVPTTVQQEDIASQFSNQTTEVQNRQIIYEYQAKITKQMEMNLIVKQEELFKLEIRIKEQQEQQQKLETVLDDTILSIENRLQKQKQLQHTIQLLEQKIMNGRKEAQEIQGQIDTMEIKLKMVDDQVQESEKEIYFNKNNKFKIFVEEQVAKQEKKLSQLNTQLTQEQRISESSLISHLNDLQSQIEIAEQKVVQINKIKQLEAQKQSLERQLDQSCSNYEQLNFNVKFLEEQLQDKEQKYNQIRKQGSEAKTRFQKLGDQIKDQQLEKHYPIKQSAIQDSASHTDCNIWSQPDISNVQLETIGSQTKQIDLLSSNLQALNQSCKEINSEQYNLKYYVEQLIRNLKLHRDRIQEQAHQNQLVKVSIEKNSDNTTIMKSLLIKELANEQANVNVGREARQAFAGLDRDRSNNKVNLDIQSLNDNLQLRGGFRQNIADIGRDKSFNRDRRDNVDLLETEKLANNDRYNPNQKNQDVMKSGDKQLTRVNGQTNGQPNGLSNNSNYRHTSQFNQQKSIGYN